jgi:acyl-CoA thioester hydrolase
MGGCEVVQPAISGWRDGWYVVPIEVSWRDLDAIGHVNNAVYFSYFEWARTKYWFDFTGRRGTRNLDFIVAHAECDFRRELTLAEQIETCVRIGEIRNSSFDFENEIRVRDGGEVAATGKVTAVLYSWQRNEKMRFTEEMREKIRTFQQKSS